MIHSPPLHNFRVLHLTSRRDSPNQAMGSSSRCLYHGSLRRDHGEHLIQIMAVMMPEGLNSPVQLQKHHALIFGRRLMEISQPLSQEVIGN